MFTRVRSPTWLFFVDSLCELASKRAVALFSEVGLQQNWPSRLRELLRVPVSIEDGLSQHICHSCSGKVETVERKLQALNRIFKRFLTRCHHTAIFDDTEMKRAYTKQLYERIYKQTRIKPDPQVFLGMAARAQTVDTRPFFFNFRAAWV